MDLESERMAEQQMMVSTRKAPTLRVGQAMHVIGLALLLVATWAAWQYAGSPSPVVFWTAVVIPVVHQSFVWIIWRLQLQGASARRTVSFAVYLAIFFVLFGGRFVSLLALAWADRGSLQLPVIPRVVLTVLFTAFGVYAMYSVARFFGLARAAGADHFDPRYRDRPLVSRGVFRFTSNGMYLYAFLLFWAVAVALNSVAAVVVATFSHAYIWVHYYATEKPDMDYLYGAAPERGTD
jgi:hypothetical protein